MRACSVVCVLALLTQSWRMGAACGSGNDTTLLHVQGQSGKFTLYTASRGRSNGIQVWMDALRELDASGNAVGTSGNPKHSINTFAAQDFSIRDPEDVTIGEGVSATKVSFSSPVSTIGEVQIDTYVMCEDGVVGTGNETWGVRAGDVKWNIELYSWTWCGCQQGQNQQVGDMVEVDITVKGLVDAQQGSSGRSVDLGGGLTLELSDQVTVDGEPASMPDGFPQVSFQGSRTILTFRFPKFRDRLVYDPVVAGFAPDVEVPEETTGTPAPDDSTTAMVTNRAGTNLPGALVLACFMAAIALTA
mmetsp:Transcript_171034/g.415702  ORF Transcript_171034/g.415702 Transcript_171034/m.415702 type:complete len:303 (+) Transcript_171034:59-967(+)